MGIFSSKYQFSLLIFPFRENVIPIVKFQNRVTKACKLAESTFCELCANVRYVVIIPACC